MTARIPLVRRLAGLGLLVTLVVALLPASPALGSTCVPTAAGQLCCQDLLNKVGCELSGGGGGPGNPPPGDGDPPGTPPGEDPYPYEACGVDALYITPTREESDGSFWHFATFICYRWDGPDDATVVRTYEDWVCTRDCPDDDTPPPPSPINDEPPVDVRDRAEALVDLHPVAWDVTPDRGAAGLPVWLSIPPGEFVAGHGSSTSDLGFFEVAVTATPLEVIWRLGEREWRCDGPGTNWSMAGFASVMAAGGEMSGTPHCAVFFSQSSDDLAGGPLPSSVTVSWDYTWSLNGVDMGSFTTLESPLSQFDLEIRELQGVITE